MILAIPIACSSVIARSISSKGKVYTLCLTPCSNASLSDNPTLASSGEVNVHQGIRLVCDLTGSLNNVFLNTIPA